MLESKEDSANQLATAAIESVSQAPGRPHTYFDTVFADLKPSADVIARAICGAARLDKDR
jgi:hypothetical protein